jgi:hypothetical protein
MTLCRVMAWPSAWRQSRRCTTMLFHDMAWGYGYAAARGARHDVCGAPAAALLCHALRGAAGDPQDLSLASPSTARSVVT